MSTTVAKTPQPSDDEGLSQLRSMTTATATNHEQRGPDHGPGNCDDERPHVGLHEAGPEGRLHRVLFGLLGSGRLWILG